MPSSLRNCRYGYGTFIRNAICRVKMQLFVCSKIGTKELPISIYAVKIHFLVEVKVLMSLRIKMIFILKKSCFEVSKMKSFFYQQTVTKLVK